MDESSEIRYPKIRDPFIHLFVRKWKWTDSRIILFFSVFSAFILIGVGLIASVTYTGVGRRIYSLDNIGFILVWVLYFIPILWGMYFWQIRATKNLFETLQNNKVFNDKNSQTNAKAKTIRQTLFQKLTPNSFYLLAFALVGIFWLYQLNIGWPQQFKIVFQYWYEVRWYFPLHILAWTVGLYALVVIVVRQLIIVFAFSEFIESAELQLEILDPDAAGGLGEIGSFIKTSSMFAIGLGVVAAVYAFEVYLSGSTILERWDVLVFFGIYIVFTPLCLIIPLIYTQRSMRKARNKVLEPIAKEFQETLEITQSKINEITTNDLKALNERLDQLQKHREIILQNFPLSPIPVSTLRGFSISAILPLVSGATSIALQLFGK